MRLYTLLKAMIQNTTNPYPVGSIYMSVNSTSPATLFGGTWVQIQGQFLLGCSSTYTAGSTGGAATVTLTTSQIPSHTHTFTGSSVSTGNQSANHTHSLNSHTHSVSITSGSGGSHNHSAYGIQIKNGYQTTDTSHWQVLRSVTLSNKGSTGYVSTASNHTHTVSGTTGGNSGSTGSNSANHSHTVTAKGTNSNTGGGSSHNNMPPYLAVYIWKRTA